MSTAAVHHVHDHQASDGPDYLGCVACIEHDQQHHGEPHDITHLIYVHRDGDVHINAISYDELHQPRSVPANDAANAEHIVRVLVERFPDDWGLDVDLDIDPVGKHLGADDFDRTVKQFVAEHRAELNSSGSGANDLGLRAHHDRLHNAFLHRGAEFRTGELYDFHVQHGCDRKSNHAYRPADERGW